MINGGIFYIDLKNANASVKPKITGISNALAKNDKPIYLVNFNNGAHYDYVPLIKYGTNSYYYIKETGAACIVTVDNDQFIFT